jgi:WD40 repeat protein
VQYLASCSQDNNIRLWKIQPLENIQKEIEVDTKNEIDEQDIK